MTVLREHNYGSDVHSPPTEVIQTYQSFISRQELLTSLLNILKLDNVEVSSEQRFAYSFCAHLTSKEFALGSGNFGDEELYDEYRRINLWIKSDQPKRSNAKMDELKEQNSSREVTD